MSDKLLALRHKKALELLQMPGTKEHLEELTRKSINITALKNITEYKEIEARKNGVNFESVGEVIRTKSAGAGGRNFANGEERRSGKFTPTRMIKPGRLALQDQYPTLSEHTTNMSDLGLLNTNIGKYVRINVRKYKENELCLRPLIQVGDLIHKEESL
ncbi:hypothetical protein RhiirA4_479198 [Rhizophagus irregularis]|uniref:Uncharacterized protein n=1 Tax=Rhizophagus irregularis TaxID=588596 RepID=A0A2I1HG32_9GLOM|nr:hypothetical protein RhiirA4_479198 [Rhizophagus irregularis]